MTGWVHHYISTACEHALGENRPELHAKCRLSCKWAEDGVESCRCPCHISEQLASAPPSWVDQARDIARELLAACPVRYLPTETWRRYATDPALFWLRGEEQPPGVWTPPEVSDDR